MSGSNDGTADSDLGTVYIVPLGGTPELFTITLGGVVYQMRIQYRDIGASWILDIMDQSSNPIVMGIPLVAGADLLAQYHYLGFTGKLIVQSDGDITLPPTYTSLGVTCQLYYCSGA